MVECTGSAYGSEGWEEEDADGWGKEDDEGWGNENSEAYDYDMNVELPDADDGKNYRVMDGEAINNQVLERVEELIDLYAMEEDQLILIARHYDWSADKMQNWFNEQDKLQF